MKPALWKKYFARNCLRCLDNPPRVRKGYGIFSILSKVLNFFVPNLTWIPRNGKWIKIWEESIMGDPPLTQLLGIGPLLDFMSSHNLITLWDISDWNQDCSNSWRGWKIQCPPHLDNVKSMLISNLKVKALVSKSSKDARG